MINVSTAVEESVYNQVDDWTKKWNTSMPEALRRIIDLGLQSLGKL